ncbi:protein kinase-like protein [Purpureocillium lilacinum]|nr:protein kinase-like protein [Purpureocillium lilacinum]OAQ84651.1 protein kinase-like protein [Purpureocillium lilacinum]OAQ89192.1 protein kinase-like protein [Purpureocillium lilacinum]
MLDDSFDPAGQCMPNTTQPECVDEDEGLAPGIAAFFCRNGLCPSTAEACDAYARMRFPIADIKRTSIQGYCSYTLCVSGDRLLQFRPEPHELNMDICRNARAVFGALVPMTMHLGSLQGIVRSDMGGAAAPRLHVYLQEKLPGISLAHVKEQTIEQRRRLVEDLAEVFATSYLHSRPPDEISSVLRGRVGASLAWRLQLLQGLHDDQLSHHVATATQHLDTIAALPWCLTHGDLVPSNVLVDPASGRLTGLVDWAEGEWLPLGLGLYGLEELLGRDVPGRGYEYFDDHKELRGRFWERFMALAGSCDVGGDGFPLRWRREEVALSRKLGILLWRGIAFDDGRIDRVVEAGRDDAEIRKLRLFLEVPCPVTREYSSRD